MIKQETNSTEKVWELEYTEKDIEELRAKGIPEDELPRIGIHKFRRARHIKPDAKRKEKISINLDGDVLEYFRRNAEASSVPYQTRINQILRRAMESEKENSSLPDIENILNDEKFLKKLKEKLASV